MEFGIQICIKGKIEAKNLSPKTYYAAYFVLKFEQEEHLETFRPFKPILPFLYLEGEEEKRKLNAFEGFPMEREDGWMEIEMGQFFTQGDDLSIIFNVYPTCLTCRFIFEGIEFRPISKGIQ